MNDPWDVKSVRNSGLYVSCMKLNGSPLLPPVLSKECREEMKKYKFIALQVEKKISALKAYIVENEIISSGPESDVTEFPESDQSCDVSVQTFGRNVEKNKSVNLSLVKNAYENGKHGVSNAHESLTLNKASDSIFPEAASKLVIDLSFSISDKSRNLVDGNNISLTPNDVPERDCDFSKNSNKRILEVDDTDCMKPGLEFSLTINKENLSDLPTPTPLHFSADIPTSQGTKSFTGSLNDLYTASVKDSKAAPLLRQRSYTVLTPSPLLLAHLRVQSVNKGVDVKSISMSESLSNISCKNKKRRSWDLESAKIKWSSMALELQEKVKGKHLKGKLNIPHESNIMPRKTQANTQIKPRSFSLDKTKRPMSKPLAISRSKSFQSPVKKYTQGINKSPLSQKKVIKDVAKQTVIADSDDPATRVRNLYEKIQNQQLTQMSNLVEKQKKEQILLHQMFEQQNKLLFAQLKTICPKSPEKIKEAWVEKDSERGPVSLSQLMDQKTEIIRASPVMSTLNETNNYIDQCDKVLKKSRGMSDTIKRQPSPTEGRKVVTPKSLSATRKLTHSPNLRNSQTSRKLVYETSVSSDHDYEILTDRTSDTLADLNVTFPSDPSDECPRPDVTLTNTCARVNLETSFSVPLTAARRAPDSAIKCLEDRIYNAMNSALPSKTKHARRSPTPNKRAAATTIVAFAKGYLVRRLMRTERVQGTVQTIKDTLMLALQLHQDGDGIWGADVDLHRRLIQQITAACYSLHDTFVASSPAERCAMIAADRIRRAALASRPPPRQHRPTEL